MILHVCILDKFIPSFIEFMQENFDVEEHQFWVSGNKEKYKYKKAKNIYQTKKGKFQSIVSLIYLAYMLNRADKIIIHSLFNQKVVIALAMMPWLLKKCYWMIWGGDLYVHKFSERNIKWKIREIFRRPVIKNMGNLVTYIKGDVDLARSWYGATGQYHECIMYPSNMYKNLNIQKKETNEINIQVGNSADPSNNHIEVLEKLLKYKDESICIYTPLSYGNSEYADKVISLGSEWFGKKFIPLVNFMPFEEYINILGSIDVAIFNHKRQQAMGNIITLLGLGKMVYMRNDTTQWSFFEDKNVFVKDVEKISDILALEELSAIGNQDKNINIDIIKKYFSKENYLEQLRRIF